MQGIEIRSALEWLRDARKPTALRPASSDCEGEVLPLSVEAPRLRHDVLSLDHWLDLNA